MKKIISENYFYSFRADVFLNSFQNLSLMHQNNQLEVLITMHPTKVRNFN